eukprot:g32676.t1
MKETLLPAGSSPSLGTLAWNFLVLGATAFGGPPVHISMFRSRFVEKYGWLSSDRFAELFAMANCLPGPSSTQVAFAIGMTQGGVKGGSRCPCWASCHHHCRSRLRNRLHRPMLLLLPAALWASR